MTFVHLHCHSEHSRLDGLSKVDAMVAKAAADNQPAIALTDHGSLGGWVELHDACVSHDIKPIYGIEAYFVPHIEDKRANKDQARHHITLLAMNQTGYHNLLKMTEQSELRGFYGKPLVDYSSLCEYNSGVIATTGCMASVINRHILNGEAEIATKHLSYMKEIFGDRLYIERQWNGIPDQDKADEGLLNLPQAQGMQYVITNDCHYVHAGDAHHHDCLLAQQTGARLTDQDRFRFSSATNWVRTAAEMRMAPYNWIDQAMETTLEVASRVEAIDIGIDTGRILIPDGGFTPKQWRQGILNRCTKQLKELGLHCNEYRSRLDLELNQIESSGALEYFGLVTKLCDFARDNGIMKGPGRGSVGGSLVAFLLGITSIDPIEYGLFFERFMNPGRKGLPDIDLDFDHAYRPQILDYFCQTYGDKKVAIIGTNSIMGAKKSLQASCKVHNRGDLERPFSAAVPEPEAGKSPSLAVCLDEDSAKREGDRAQRFYDMSAELRRLADGRTDDWREDEPGSPLVPYNSQPGDVASTALALENTIFALSNHAGAVVVSSRDISEDAAIRRNPKQPDSVPITQWTMGTIERLGLLKIDVLGVKTLQSIALTCQTTGVHIESIPLDDDQTYQLISDAETSTVFQLSGDGIKDFLKRATVQTIEDIANILALYRPGPMGANSHLRWARRSSGEELPTPEHPMIAESLDESSLGLIITQEEIMRIVRDVAGFSLAEADDLRKATGKKIDSLMKAQRDKFISGGINNGHKEHDLSALWSIIDSFSDYSFNKSHAIGYALLSYQTAYLKVHYPAEWYASCLASYASNREKVSDLYRQISLDNRVRLLPPGPGSSSQTTGSDGVLRMGSSALKGCSGDIPTLSTHEVLSDPVRRCLAAVIELRLAGVRANAIRALALVGGLDQAVGFPCGDVASNIMDGTKLNNCLNRARTHCRKNGIELDAAIALDHWQWEKFLLSQTHQSPVDQARAQIELMGISLHDNSEILRDVVSRWRELQDATISAFMAKTGYINRLPMAVLGWDDWKARSGKNRGRTFRTVRGELPWGDQAEFNLGPDQLKKVEDMRPLDILIGSGYIDDIGDPHVKMWLRKTDLYAINK